MNRVIVKGLLLDIPICQEAAMKKMILVCIVLLINLSVCHAECPDVLGKAVLKMAWPTPKYKTCDYKIRPQSNGDNILIIKSTGESVVSFLDDKEVWVELFITLDSNGSLKELIWGDRKAFMPPGATNLAIIEIAKDIMK